MVNQYYGLGLNLATYPATLANVTLNGHTVRLLSRIDNKAIIHEVKFCGTKCQLDTRLADTRCTHSDQHIRHVTESNPADAARDVV
jgi:hypothetical protein